MKIFFLFILFFLCCGSSFCSIFPDDFKFGNNLQITLYNEGLENFSISKRGDKIAYEFDGFIWIMDASGKNKIKLSEGNNPQFAPNDNLIAYQVDESIFIYNLQTSQMTKVIERGIFPKFSPGNSDIIIYLSTNSFPYNIFTYNISKKINIQITDIEKNKKIIDFYFTTEKDQIIYITEIIHLSKVGQKSHFQEVFLTDSNGIITYKLFSGDENNYIFPSNCGKKIGLVDNNLNVYIFDLENLQKSRTFIVKSDEFIFLNEEDIITPEIYNQIYPKRWMPKLAFSEDGKEIIVSYWDKKKKSFYLSKYFENGDKAYNIIRQSYPLHNIIYTKDKIVYSMSKGLNVNSPKAMFCINFIKVYVNNKIVNFEFPPVKIGEEIFVSSESISRELNFDFIYNKTRRTLKISSSSMKKGIEYYINIPQAIINKEIINLAGAPFVILDKIIYIPISSLFYAFLLDIVFDEIDEAVYISHKEVE